MLTSYRKGLLAEWLARNFLRLHGFRILASRYITGRDTGRAEIDIIACRGDLVIFVEVKRRRTDGQAIDAITFSQSGRLRAAAEQWLRANRWLGPARFDLIVLSGTGLKWFRNAV